MKTFILDCVKKGTFQDFPVNIFEMGNFTFYQCLVPRTTPRSSATHAQSINGLISTDALSPKITFHQICLALKGLRNIYDKNKNVRTVLKNNFCIIIRKTKNVQRAFSKFKVLIKKESVTD